MTWLMVMLCMIVSVLLEYGGLRSLGGWPSLVPLTASIALMVTFRLHVTQGLLWFLLAGIAADLHTNIFVGDVCIAGLLGFGLSILLRHYITHASLYAAGLIGFGTLALWGLLHGLVLSVVSGAPENWLPLLLFTPLLGALTTIMLLQGQVHLRTIINRWLLIR